MFCLESKDLIIVELYLFNTVPQKFDSTTITRLFKMPSDHEDFNSEGSNHSVSFQAVWHPLSEMLAFFKYFQLVKEVSSGVSPSVSVPKIFSSRRGGSNAADIGIKLPSVGMVLSSQ